MAMRATRFPGIHALLTGGSAAAAAAAEIEASEGAAAAASLDPAQFDAAVGLEIDKAVAANNTRWQTVMSSDKLQGNIKLASRLCASSMSTDDVLASLEDAAPLVTVTSLKPEPAAAAPGGESAAAMRTRLAAAAADTSLKTGGGEGDGTEAGASDIEAARETRKKQQEARNAQSPNGKKVGAVVPR